MAYQWSSVKILIVALLVSIFCFSTVQLANNLKLFAYWKEMKYKFPSKDIKNNALKDGNYTRGNSIPLDLAVHYADPEKPKVFVIVPKFLTGVPVTLGYITKKLGKKEPKLKPYPDYTWHSGGRDCTRITSAIRVVIDKCNRLWVVDSGRIGYNQVCPPQILGFDLQTNQQVHRYQIPASQYTPGKSLFTTPLVNIQESSGGNCENTMIYLADTEAFGLVVYDLSCGDSWRFESKLMNPVLKYENFTVSGQSFMLKYGILGMALSSHCKPQNERYLYFNALASITENTVPLRFLDNKSNVASTAYEYAFQKIGLRGIQSIVEAMDKNGNLFFSITSPNAIVCWDSSKAYIKSNMKIVAESKQNLQTVTGLKIVTNSLGKEELWVLSNRYQKFITGTLENYKVNFRILTIPLKDLLHNKKCRGTLIK